MYIYQGADGEFTLYEDEGVNYNYEQGRYAMIPMKYDEATKTLVIGERQRLSGYVERTDFHCNYGQ